MSGLFGGGKIEDRDVNSLFDSKESYNGSIILLQEREDIHAWISPLFTAGFLMWRWKVNLVFRWPGERQDLLGILSLDGRRSNTAPVNQDLKEIVGKD